jgi:prepilin signal peptidase PulO-like enzyme (type II secretory pathway)
VAMMIFKGKKRSDQIPFGPAMILGAIFSIFFGWQAINGYINFTFPRGL